MSKQHLWEPIGRDNLSTRVIRQIEEQIFAGVYEPGDKLPGERELAELLQVSRPVIRDAVRTLSALGLLAIRHGEGTFVREPDPVEYLRRASRYLALRMKGRSNSLMQLWECRLSLESSIVRLAAKRIQPEQLECLQELLVVQEDAVDRGDVAAFAQADQSFHLALAEASGNDVFVHLLSAVAELLYASTARTNRVDGGAPRSAFTEHRTIYRHVANGDVEGAVAALRRHLGSTREALEKERPAPDPELEEPEPTAVDMVGSD